MTIQLEDAKKRISRYLQRKKDVHPRLVNVNNTADMRDLLETFHVGNNVFRSVSSFSLVDENLSEDRLYQFLNQATGILFLTGFASYYRLLGERKLIDFLKQVSQMSSSRLHLVVFLYQCEFYLEKVESRYSQFIYCVGDSAEELPQLIFLDPATPIPSVTDSVDGIQNVADYVEQTRVDTLYVRTKKVKADYPNSLYSITEQRNSYDVLKNLDSKTNLIPAHYGNDKEWSIAQKAVSECGSWEKYFNQEFGSVNNLAYVVSDWKNFDEYHKWLYAIAVKMFRPKNNNCLCEAAGSDTYQYGKGSFLEDVYRSILSHSSDDPRFWDYYDEWKLTLKRFGASETDAIDYCSVVRSKGRNSLYYISDVTNQERKCIFALLNEYAEDYTRDEIMSVLKHVYPDLYDYLQPYDFKIDLLNSYFRDYKYQKVINRILPEFRQKVDDEAEKREYNLLLPVRSKVVDTIPKKGTVVYFMDAMGVEYLSYIMAECHRYKLMTQTSICHCELPSITSMNKEFVETFRDGGAQFIPDENGVKDIDNIKHHGKLECDFTQNKLPSYLSDELRVIHKTIEDIALRLKRGDYQRAVMISDHGASRLCVLNNSENKWSVDSKGQHSGRCCPKSEISEKPDCATEENGFWVLANYDRFQGGRAANVEVHGGATLEEVVIPVIQMTYSDRDIEINLTDDTKTITFSRKKKDAVIKVFSNTKLPELHVKIKELDKEYSGTTRDQQLFTIAVPDLRKSGDYLVDVYSGDNLLASGLTFTAKNAAFSENNMGL